MITQEVIIGVADCSFSESVACPSIFPAEAPMVQYYLGDVTCVALHL